MSKYRVIGFDFETSAFPNGHPWQEKAFPVSLCIVDESQYKKTWIFNHKEVPVPDPMPKQIQEIQGEIDRSDRIVGHNLKFDCNWSKYVGLDLSKVKFWCTQVVEYLIEGHKKMSYSLEQVSIKRGIPPKIDKVKTFWQAGYNTDEIPLSILLPYGEQDSINTLMIYQRQVRDVKRLGLEAVVNIEMEKLRVLSDIECNGMKVYKGLAKGYIKEFTKKVEVIDKKIKALAEMDFNISSNDELSAVLYGGVFKRKAIELVEKRLKSGEVKQYERNCMRKIPVKGLGFKPPRGSETKKKGYFKTNKDVLAQLKGRSKTQKDFLKLLKKRSEKQKALETFSNKDGTKGLISKIQSDGCIHSNYNQAVTRTGRLSSSDPNSQNLPRKGTSPVKMIFIPKYDFIGNADLAQLEWRVAAYLSQDPVIIKEIMDGVDYHLDNAIRFFGDKKYRTDAKVFGFRLLYGGVAYGMYMDATMPNFSLKKWEAICREYYEKYEQLKIWQDNNVALVNKQGYLISPSGRILTFDKKQTRDGSMEYNRSDILNYPVQSFATADIMGLAMYAISYRMKRAKLKSELICQVHDSLLSDLIKKEVAEVARISIDSFEQLPKYMKKFWGIDFNIPLTGDFEIGDSYGNLTKYKLAA